MPADQSHDAAVVAGSVDGWRTKLAAAGSRAAAAFHEGERQRADLEETAMALAGALTGARDSMRGMSKRALAQFWKALQAWLSREKLTARPPLDLTPPLPEPTSLPSQLQTFELSPDTSPPRLTAGRLVGCLAAPHGPTVVAVAAAA